MSSSRLWLALPLLFACTNNHYAPSTLVRVDSETAGANCANGGVAIHQGTDANHNGTLDDSEIDSTQYVCSAPSPLKCEGGNSLTGIITVGSTAELAQLAGITCI